jgi:hypothetical protein
MDPYANARRDNLDLVFVGGFSRHHAKRNKSLRAAASTPWIRAREDSRLTRLADFLPFIPVSAPTGTPRKSAR